jgi:Concanavalin A-like lectin/glucanases superfamily
MPLYPNNNQNQIISNNTISNLFDTKGNMTQNIIIKKLGYLASVGLAVGLASSASALDYRWTGNAGGGLWSTPGNWDLGAVPTDAAGNNAFVGNTNSPITIAAGDTQSVGTNSDHVSTWGTVYGPEFGATLNIYGTLNFDWGIAPVQGDPNPANRSILNLYSGSSLNGVNIALGDGWWAAIQNLPYATMNLYGDAQVNARNLWWGGHVNIYDTASMTLTNDVGVIDLTRIAVSDATRSMNLAGGQLILATGQGARVSDWITRGILLAYGKSRDTNEIIITDDGFNTIVTNVPLGGALQRIRFQPLLRPSMMSGTFQQATLVGDYPGVSGVVLSSRDPGLNLAVVGHPVYTSSKTNVVKVDTNGLLSAISPGTATVTAKLGAFSSTNALLVTVTPVTASLAHRYSFSESSGTTTADTIGGSTWDGTLFGGSSFSGGKLVLDGNDGYVQLPAGVVSNMDEVTIEAWVTFDDPVNNFASLYGFGDQDGTTFLGANYIRMVPRTGIGTALVSFGIGVPGTANEQNAILPGGLSGAANMQIVAVYHPLAGTQSCYTNGVLAATYNNLTTPLAYQATYDMSSLRYVLGADPLNYLGQSLSLGDNFLNGSIDEFRIYSGPLAASQVRADYLLGPNQLFGTSTSVSLTVTLAGTNLLIKWPTTSALVNLTSSPALGTGAAWTPVNGTLAVVSGNYQLSVPVTGLTRFFRLEQ